MKVSFAFLIVSFFLGITIPTSTFSQDNQTNDQTSVIPQASPVDEQVSKMTPEQKVGQLLMIGILESQMTSDLEKRIQNIKPGFLILFRKNIVTPLQTANLIYGIQQQSIKNSGLQLIAAVDQEGGDVVRIPTKPSLPTALALGRSFDYQSTHSIGKYVGEVLSVLGIHMNLAPVLDISDPEKISFIQTRSFGGNPEDVAKISNEFASGVQSAGVVSTAKHFPGLGNMKDDSHKKMVQNNVSKEEFFSKYLKPYEELIKEKSISAVMMTHLVYPELDPTLKPATFSPTLINILKNNLNFSGLVITDDIEMAGAKYYATPEERALQAFLAGNDVLMVAWNKKSQAAVYNGLLAAYKSGAITEERLNSSLKKILTLKLSLNLNVPVQRPDSKIILAKLRANSLKQPVDSIFGKIMTQELRRLDNKKSALDLERLTVVSADANFYKKFKFSYKNKTNFIPLTKSFVFQDHLDLLNKSSLVILNVSGPISAKFVNELPLSLKKKSIVLNSRFLGSIRNEENFVDVLQLSMKHSDVGSYFGAYLGGPSQMEPSLERGLSSVQTLDN
jgi:beta-N-acetylhexosaminidase